MHFLRAQFSVPYSFKFKKHLEVSFHFHLFHLFLNKIPQKLSSKLPVLKVFHQKKKKSKSDLNGNVINLPLTAQNYLTCPNQLFAGTVF